LPDETEISFGPERFTYAEMFFEPSKFTFTNEKLVVNYMYIIINRRLILLILRGFTL